MVFLCGIFGIAGFNDKGLLKKMDKILVHRGPDDSGYFFDKDICMGNRRLSIIDVKGGKQPIHNEDETVWTVYNGEIYNYIELKNELEKKGHRFYTSSDTEIIVHSYEEFGEKFVTRLRGMFAIAIWDSKNRKLILARDRVGKKPLYYTMVNGNIIFASEMKALLLYEEVKRRINSSVLSSYLSLRYCPGHETLLEGVYKLLPAHILEYKNKKIVAKKYWNPHPLEEAHSDSYYIKILADLIKDAVNVRMMSEVPLGVYLSGGLDSTTIVGFMHRLGIENINTFSIGFGAENDETGFADYVSDFYGTRHKNFFVNKINIKKILPKIIWHLDEPLADITNIPTYIISQLAKKHVTVVLSGEGGDELFSGYAHEKAMIITQRLSALMNFVNKTGLVNFMNILPVSFLNRFFEYPASMGQSGKEKFIQYVKYADDEVKRYEVLINIFNSDEKKQIFANKNEFDGSGAENIFNKFFSLNTNISNKMLFIDISHWLPGYILLRLDKMTMAHSIEARAPFLDHNLIEFSMRVPLHLKLNGNTEKYILRKAVKGLIPDKIAERKKRTFITPMYMWGEKTLLDLCNVLYEGDFFSKKYIDFLIGDYRRSKLLRERQLWALINLELWKRVFIDNEIRVNGAPRIL